MNIKSQTPGQLFSMMYESSHLDPAEVKRLEALVEQTPDDLLSRAVLIGHYYYKSGAEEFRAEHVNWQKHMRWLVENKPAEPLLGKIGDMVIDGLDPVFYKDLSALWGQKIESEPSNAQILANAAACSMISDLPQARRFIIRAMLIAPDDNEVRRIERAISSLEQPHSTGRPDG